MVEKLLETMVRSVAVDDDLKALYDVLLMLAQTVDEQAEEIAQLKRRMDRINAALPSTDIRG